MSNIYVDDKKGVKSYDINSTSDENDLDISYTQTQISGTDNSEETRIQNVIKYKMCFFLRELSLLLLLLYTYTAFQTNSTKLSKIPNAFPFFPAESVVKDWHNGELSEAIELASESDLAFIMYYAPWDAECQNVKHEFIIAALHMHKQIHFAAINCWNPGSECQQQYNKVYSWPVLIAYPIHGRGIQYRGPKKAEYMLKFLQSMLNPFKRINNLVNITKYQAINDAVVVAFVDPKLGSLDYGIFYTTAIKFLERDPFREIEFLVCTALPKKLDKFYANSLKLPSLHLYLWNETLHYPTSNDWNPDSLLLWINENLHQSSMWISPTGGKSETLSHYLQPGPTLVLFTPRNPLYEQIDYYSVLHNVALKYYNCGKKTEIQIQNNFNWILRKEFHTTYKKLFNKCVIPKNIKKINSSTVISDDLNNSWLNNTFNCKIPNNFSSMCNEDVCTNVNYSKSSIFKKESLKYQDNFIFKSNIEVKNDWRSPESLINLYEKLKCQYYRLAYEMHPALLAPLILSENNDDNITGLACRTNKSLSILALDSLQYHHFAKGLGIDILNIKDKSAVVILNPALETHHVMKNTYSSTNLESFIYKFTKGLLERTLSSSLNVRLFSKNYGFKSVQHNNTSRTFVVQELNTNNFLSTIMSTNMAVIVMYYSTKCAFCNGVSHTLLSVAKLLHPVSDLQFFRIDGDNNGLPWEYSMHQYPSILFFPTRRKSENRVFPQTMPITFSNLLSFILVNVESHMKIHIMWTICNTIKIHENFDICIRSMKRECMSLIGRLLRVYRFSFNTQQRTALLKNLQHLRSLLFVLENTSQKENIKKFIPLPNLLSKVPRKRR